MAARLNRARARIDGPRLPMLWHDSKAERRELRDVLNRRERRRARLVLHRWAPVERDPYVKHAGPKMHGMWREGRDAVRALFRFDA